MTPPASAASRRRARLAGQRHAIAVAQEDLGRTAPALLVVTIADPTRRVDPKLGTACTSDGVDSAASGVYFGEAVTAAPDLASDAVMSAAAATRNRDRRPLRGIEGFVLNRRIHAQRFRTSPPTCRCWRSPWTPGPA